MQALNYKLQQGCRRIIAGSVLAAASMLICCLHFSSYIGAVFAALFLAAGFFVPTSNHTGTRYFINFFWGMILTTVTCVVSFTMTTTFDMVAITPLNAALNILCVLIPCAVMLFITARPKTSFIVASFLLTLLATCNGIIYQFRGKELSPMDFLSFKTAMNVASQYKAVITPGMAYGWLTWLWFVFVLLLLPAPRSFPKISMRLSSAFAAVIFVTVLWYGTSDVPIKTWASQGTEINGYYLNFVLGIRNSMVEKPDNYTPQEVNESSKEYPAASAPADKSLPNIIVIMDESFADFRIFGGELRTNQPVTPFLDSLEENTIRGYALTPVFGGNTANAEFEFLTGHSLHLLPDNAIPYQQYIGGKLFSLAWLMNSYGYKTLATHPFGANGWSRNIIYPYLGFNESTFSESYPGDDVVRCYISDREMFEYVLGQLNTKPSASPLFLFGVTIQNHGGYDFEGVNYSKTIELEGYSKDYPFAESYLSLINRTDSAMEYLLTELESYSEDTLVLFFGDHFPYVESEFFAELNGGYFSTLSDRMEQYTVPFIIWANYDIPETEVELTSLKSLPGYLLEAAGFELPPYYRFMADMEKCIPAMNTLGYYSSAMQQFVTYDDASGEEALWLDKYASLQYNNLFDSKNRSSMFYGQYITE